MARGERAIARKKDEDLGFMRPAWCGLFDVARMHHETTIGVGGRLSRCIPLAVDLKRIHTVPPPESHHNCAGEGRLGFRVDDSASIGPSRMIQVTIPSFRHLLLGHNGRAADEDPYNYDETPQRQPAHRPPREGSGR